MCVCHSTVLISPDKISTKEWIPEKAVLLLLLSAHINFSRLRQPFPVKLALLPYKSKTKEGTSPSFPPTPPKAPFFPFGHQLQKVSCFTQSSFHFHFHFHFHYHYYLYFNFEVTLLATSADNPCLWPLLIASHDLQHHQTNVVQLTRFQFVQHPLSTLDSTYHLHTPQATFKCLLLPRAIPPAPSADFVWFWTSQLCRSLQVDSEAVTLHPAQSVLGKGHPYV